MVRQINNPARETTMDSQGTGLITRSNPSLPLTKEMLKRELYHAKGLIKVSAREVNMERIPDRAPPMAKKRVKKGLLARVSKIRKRATKAEAISHWLQKITATCALATCDR